MRKGDAIGLFTQAGSKRLHPSFEAQPIRRTPVHGVRVSLGKPTIVFVTVCTKDRQPWLAQPEVHEAIRRIWQESTAWLVGRYVLMPDHMHFFCAPHRLDQPLGRWIAFWKRRFTRLHVPGTGRWQRDYWDTRLRRLENYDAKWEYVRNNPVRHGLCESADQWPYQGEVFVLRW